MRPLPWFLGAVVVISQSAPSEEPPRLPSAESTAVLVDVVVRDGKGRPVTDLTAADFEVLEDGGLQTLQQFVPPNEVSRAVAEASRTKVPAADPSATATPLADPHGERDTIAFVFDRLSTAGRVAAGRATREYLRERGLESVAGVFSVEDTLVVLQDFTADPALVLLALDALDTRVAHAGETRLDQSRASTASRVAANRAVATLALMPMPRNADEALRRAQLEMVAKAQAIADAFDHLARDEQGFVTAHALTAIVDALRSVPGRKAVVLFSEGLYRTEATENRFLSVIHSANRASVSVYAVEAAGLQTTTLESLTAAGIASQADRSMAVQSSGRDTGGGSYTRGLEQAEDLVKFNPRASLQWISDSTGGAFVRDTNDFVGALHRIGSDLRSYYLLGYTPRNEQFDGRFRKIAVRVRRKGLEVRSRSGYFAVRSAGPVLAHVAPALALLEAGKRPHAIEVFAGAWPFPEGDGPARAPVVVTVPATAVSRLASRAKGRMDVTLLARIRDAEGKPVDAMSRRFVFDAGAAPGDLLLLRDARLPAGRYTLEAVAYEAGGAQAGVVTADLAVGDGSKRLECAQLVIVRGALPADQAPADLETGHPLRFGDVILQPSAGEPLPRQGQRPLVFQVTVPSSRSASPPATVAEVWRADNLVSRTHVQWGPADATGRLRHIADLPLASLAAGPYELRVTLKDAADQRVITARFVVSE